MPSGSPSQLRVLGLDLLTPAAAASPPQMHLPRSSLLSTSHPADNDTETLLSVAFAGDTLICPGCRVQGASVDAVDDDAASTTCPDPGDTDARMGKLDGRLLRPMMPGATTRAWG